MELARFRTQPYTCPYLPYETASLDYRIAEDMSAEAYHELLRRGWRRFGFDFFRPACPRCVKCRSLRIDVQELSPQGLAATSPSGGLLPGNVFDR